MKTGLLALLVFVAFALNAQKLRVPTPVKAAFVKQYPAASHVTWEKEKGNYEANWGGQSGEDHSVMYTPSGGFIEAVEAIQISQLPNGVAEYIQTHYKGAKITEAGRVTDARGKISYEAEVRKKDILFDENGKFIKED